MNTTTRTLHAAVLGLGLGLGFSPGPGGAAQAAESDVADSPPAPPALAEPGTGPRAEPEAGTEAGETSGQAGRDDETPPPVQVNRRQQHGQTITEYVRGGRVFLMTVKPRQGPTQYWDDIDGDGQFQNSTSSDLDENMNLPKWRLGGW